jgi:hypothetical protein
VNSASFSAAARVLSGIKLRQTLSATTNQPSGAMRIATSYIPHALSAVAVMSISIHLVNKRRTFSDEEASARARISILESIAEQLRSERQPSSNGEEELERLKRLVRAPVVKESKDATAAGSKGISWKDVVFGRKRPAGDELSHWEKKDLEKGSVTIQVGSTKHVTDFFRQFK